MPEEKSDLQESSDPVFSPPDEGSVVVGVEIGEPEETHTEVFVYTVLLILD